MTNETNRLRVIRAERRMSQLTLAAVTRIHPTRVWKIENGYVAPSPKERQAIASALGASESVVWPTTDRLAAKGSATTKACASPRDEPGED